MDPIELSYDNLQEQKEIFFRLRITRKQAQSMPRTHDTTLQKEETTGTLIIVQQKFSRNASSTLTYS